MFIRVEPAKGKPDRMSVFADEEYVMSVDAKIWYSLGFGNEEELSRDEFENLQFVADSRKAYDSAIRMLTLRAHSEFELKNKLLRKGYSGCFADSAIEKCKELGFIDDLDFGIRYGTELVKNKRYGPIRLRNALIAKGLSRSDIIDAMHAIDYDSTACILELIEKKYSDCFDSDKKKRKMIDGIMRHGYSFSDITTAIREYNENTDGEKYEL